MSENYLNLFGIVEIVLCLFKTSCVIKEIILNE